MALAKVLLVSHVDLNLARFRAPLIRALAERGVDVAACVPRGRYAGEIEALGARLVDFPLARGSLNPLRLPGSVRALGRVIRNEAPDVVHSFTHQPNVLTRLAAPPGTLVANSVTGLGSCFLGTGARGAALRALFQFLYRSTASRCRALVFQNDDDKGYFQSRGLAGRSLVRLIRGSGADLDKFFPERFTARQREEARQALGLESTQTVFTLAARLLADKGVREFLEAAASLAGSCPDARFLLVGEPDPGNPSSLTPGEMARARDMGNVVLTCWREDVPMVWALSDVAVLPSYREGLPVSLQEAMASGLPVVATDVPGCREVAGPEGNALLVPARDPAALARAMRGLAESPEQRRDMGAASRRLARERFDARGLALEHLALYEELLEAGK